MTTYTNLDLAKLTNTRNEQALLCNATGISEHMVYGDNEYNWLANNLGYSYKEVEKGNVKILLIKVTNESDFVAGRLFQYVDGKEVRQMVINTESDFLNFEKQVQ